MKILFILETFPVFSESFILNQITGLIDRGHDVKILSGRLGDAKGVLGEVNKYDLLNRTFLQPELPDNWILRIAKGLKMLVTNGLFNLAVLFRSLNFFKYDRYAFSFRLFYAAIPLLKMNTTYDIIYCHFGMNGILGELLLDLKLLHGKLVTVFHGVDITAFYQEQGKNVYKRLFNRGDLFLSISDRWKCRLIELDCNKEKILVHKMGIDSQKFLFKSRQLCNDNIVRIVTIGRLVEKKGLEYSIRAVAKLAKANQNIEYTIVGGGPQEEYLKNIVHELNVGDIVHLIGWKTQQNVIEILEKSHIMLVPSITAKNGDQEGIPVVIMEGMALGMPILSTQHSGIPELVKNGVSGFLVPERKADALYEKLKYLVENSQIWSDMGLKGHNFVKEYHNLNKQNDKLDDIFRNLLTKN